MKIITRDNNERPMRYPIRSIFDDFFTPSIWDTPLSFNTPTLSADLWEEKDDVFVKMALPGISKEDIKLDIMADSVTISGHSKKEERSDDDSKKYYFRSMDSSYEQSFNLPTKIDPDKAEAEFKDGVLTIKMPKANEVKPKQIEIK